MEYDEGIDSVNFFSTEDKSGEEDDRGQDE